MDKKVYETPRVTTLHTGKAAVYFCDPDPQLGCAGFVGCGLFSFYKPEVHTASHCPGCGAGRGCFKPTGDIVLMAVEGK